MIFPVTTAETVYETYFVEADDPKSAKDALSRVFRAHAEFDPETDDVMALPGLPPSFPDGGNGDREIIGVGGPL